MSAANKAAVDDFFRRYLQPSSGENSTNEPAISLDNLALNDSSEGPTQQDVERLAAQLQRIGFYGPLPMSLLHAGDSLDENSDAIRIFDVLQFLFQKLSKQQGPGASLNTLPEADIDLSSKCERLQADVDHLHNVRQSLLGEIKSSRQENAALQSRLSIIEDNFQVSSNAWARERDLLQKQISTLKQRDVQYQHDIRRLERDSEQLKTKMRQLLTTKDRVARVAIPLVGESTESGASSAVAGQLETYKSMVSRYDEQQRSLLFENEQLRQMLAAVTEQLRQWNDFASVVESGGNDVSTTTTRTAANDAAIQPEVFNGDVKALFENLKSKAAAGIAAKSQFGELRKLLKDQDDLLRLALNVSPQIAEKLKEKALPPSTTADPNTKS